ncbi:hypothetical protein CBL_12436 [Carabus blaptoides fortunei]
MKSDGFGKDALGNVRRRDAPQERRRNLSKVYGNEETESDSIGICGRGSEEDTRDNVFCVRACDAEQPITNGKYSAAMPLEHRSETTESEALVSEGSLCTMLSVFVKAQVTIHRRLDTTILRVSAWILIDVKYILFRNFYDPEHESESVLSRRNRIRVLKSRWHRDTGNMRTKSVIQKAVGDGVQRGRSKGRVGVPREVASVWPLSSESPPFRKSELKVSVLRVQTTKMSRPPTHTHSDGMKRGAEEIGGGKEVILAVTRQGDC